MNKLPSCCGSQMKLSLDLGRFVEVQCGKCNDVVYVKSNMLNKPMLIDD